MKVVSSFWVAMTDIRKNEFSISMPLESDILNVILKDGDLHLIVRHVPGADLVPIHFMLATRGVIVNDCPYIGTIQAFTGEFLHVFKASI